MNFETRIARLNALMIEKNVDAVLITKRENYIYFSGFNGSSAHLLITQDKRFLITDSRYIEQASKQAPDFIIVDFKANLIGQISSIIAAEGINSIGLESAFVSIDTYNEYLQKKIVKEVILLSKEIDKLRVVKDSEEIELIKKAVELADLAFNNVLKYIKPGVTELEIANEIEYHMKRNLAKKCSFETIVASGARSSLPHGVASNKKLELGDSIIIDFGAVFEDYCSDMTRTVFLGTPDNELIKIYNVVKEAQESASVRVSKGMTGIEVDKVAREIIEGHGFGNRFGHGLGHGVGLEVHEDPTLSPRGDIILRNNMIVTVEPGIYVPGFGGVRIEDMVIINDDTPIILTSSTKELIII